MGLGFVFCDERKRTTQSSQSSETSVSQSTEHKLLRVSQSSSQKILAGATHICPASIRTLNGPTSGPRCMLGFDLKPRSITTVTDLGLLGAAISKAVFLTRACAVSRTRRWMSWPTNFLAID